MGYIKKFDNVETQNEHEVSLVLAYLKCTYHFRNIGLDPWLGIYQGEFL